MAMILTAENLSKIYPGGTKAVDRISLSLNRGEIFGFLGPNGAGKTTTVKLLCGMLTPTEGRSLVLGIDPAREPEGLHRRAGVVTEHAQMYDHLTGLENLLFYGALFGMERGDSRARAKALLQRLELAGAAGRRLSAYSTGMRQRLSLARALMHRPEILFLDEPTSGLDPESAQNVNALIQELAAEGTTVFLCTHQLRYAQEICTDYGLMDKGRLFARGGLEELRGMVSHSARVRIRAGRMPEELGGRPVGTDTWEIAVDTEADIPGIVRRIVEAGGDIYHVSREELSLEELYFALIDRNQKQQGEGAL